MEETKITENLENLFNKIIKTDYLEQCDSNKEWYENVRNYIDITTDKLDNDMEEIDCIEDIKNKLTHDFTDKIVTEGFHLFVSDKCADIDENEFDTENDLAVYEWETLDDIILYYYHQMYY